MCREAVVRIAHEKAKELDKAGGGIPASEDIDLTAQLRPVTMNDFREARKKVCSYGDGAEKGLVGENNSSACALFFIFCYTRNSKRYERYQSWSSNACELACVNMLP